MRIVVATPYKIANYGAMLQAWALRIVLEKMGHSVRYLNCRYLWPGILPFKRLLLSRSFSTFFSKLRTNRMMRSSISELGGLPETQPYNRIEDLLSNPPDCDCLIAGSDQIFHPWYFSDRRRYIPILLGFGSPETKRFIYAASFGTSDATSLTVSTEARSMLSQINDVGVRETSGCRILKQIFGIDGFWTPDPCFLLEEEEYVEFFHLSRNAAQKYIVVYTLGFGRLKALRDDVVLKAKQKYGCENVHVLSSGISISEWLNEIRNAACVVTNSFHGHCFSRIFNVPFELLKFDGGDAWRNERNNDLDRVLRGRTTHDLREIGISMLQKFLSPK